MPAFAGLPPFVMAGLNACNVSTPAKCHLCSNVCRQYQQAIYAKWFDRPILVPAPVQRFEAKSLFSWFAGVLIFVLKPVIKHQMLSVESGLA